ncbi:MAG TPA: serine--tRNA ligase [Candidatus Paceibacterota bacterium]
MLDIKFIRENKDLVAKAIKDKRRPEVDLDKVLDLYDKRKTKRQELEELNRQRNIAAQERDNELGKNVKDKIGPLESEVQNVESELKTLMLTITNVPLADVVVGKDESENVQIRSSGEIPKLNFESKAHWDLGPALGVIDSEKAAEVVGARFTYLKGDLVFLQFAILQYALKVITDENKLKEIVANANLDVSTRPFIPVLPPTMIRPGMLNAMARLDPKEDKYYLPEDDLYLAGSAEHSLGPLHLNEVLKEEDLPIRYAGYSTAYRREAGAAGKDTRGILRQHQFDKLEMETFCLPENSRTEHEFLVAIQEYLVASLGLPYRVVSICTGDMGFPNQKQTDIETWMPGQNTYRETHTADLIGGFQARRLNTRLKRKDGQIEYVHMNDATAFAMGRIIIAIIENYQQADGSIKIPVVLVPYMGKEYIGKK